MRICHIDYLPRVQKVTSHIEPEVIGIYYRKSSGTSANVIFKSLYLRNALKFFHRVFDIRFMLYIFSEKCIFRKINFRL